MDQRLDYLIERCRTVFSGCDQFQKDVTLRAVFNTRGLNVLRRRVPQANRVEERVALAIDFLLSNTVQEEPALLIFLQALRQYYQPGDGIWEDLDTLISMGNDVRTLVLDIYISHKRSIINEHQIVSTFTRTIQLKYKVRMKTHIRQLIGAVANAGEEGITLEDIQRSTGMSEEEIYEYFLMIDPTWFETFTPSNIEGNDFRYSSKAYNTKYLSTYDDLKDASTKYRKNVVSSGTWRTGAAIDVLQSGSARQRIIPGARVAPPPPSQAPRPDPDIPSDIDGPLRAALLECGPFDDDASLRAVFAHQLLAPWRDNLPEASSHQARVDQTVAFLLRRRHAATRTNALVLLLTVLRNRTHPDDECHERLTDLTTDLAAALQEFTTPQAARAIALQVAQGDQQVIFSDDILRVVEYIAAVGRVRVPRILGGRVEEPLPTGTGWLIAPDLALTCYHVLVARSDWDDPPDPADLTAQVGATLLTFSYTQTGKGRDYHVAALECYDPDLDYALLRLHDRPDDPLRTRGVLPLAPADPLTPASRLLVLQHPRGLPQQVSTGRYSRSGAGPNTIFYTAPAEPGTSGAPVVNLDGGWGVVALHRGADPKTNAYRIATPIAPILADIRRRRPDLAPRLP